MSQPLMYDALPQERVYFSSSVRDALGREIDRLGAGRVFVATSKSLRQDTSAISLIASTLGSRCIAIFDDIKEHSQLDGVMAAANAARELKADLLVGIGGGTIIDGLKIVQLALAEGLTAVDQLRARKNQKLSLPHHIRQIAVPTTLSGAEVTPAAGGTDIQRGTKLAFIDRQLVPQSVIYDPAIGALTPEWLWLSSAIRGVDHCCEGILAKNANELFDAGLLQSLRLFATSLRRHGRSMEVV